MRAIAIVLFLFVPTLSSAATRSVVSKALDSTVVVSGVLTGPNDAGELESKSENYCSGFVIESKGTVEQIATAKHCTEDDPDEFTLVSPKSVTFFDGDHGLIKHISRSDTADVAVLTVRSMRHHPALKIGAEVNIGDPLYVMGMPHGTAWTLSAAQARNGSLIANMPGIGPEMYVECAGCDRGDSGAPVLDAAGGVVGVFNLGSPSRPALGWAVPIAEVSGLRG